MFKHECGHGGGRSQTFLWFQDHKIEAFGFVREPFELTPEDKNGLKSSYNGRGYNIMWNVSKLGGQSLLTFSGPSLGLRVLYSFHLLIGGLSHTSSSSQMTIGS